MPISSEASFIARHLRKLRPLRGHEITRADMALARLYYARDLLPWVPFYERAAAYQTLPAEGYEPRRMFRCLLNGGAL